jgi:hypothetical protein
MQRRRLSIGGLADRNGGKEVGLALDRRRAGALRQIHHRSHGADIVGERHDGAAVNDGGHRGDLVAHEEFGRDPLRRNVGQFDAEEIGERRLLQFGYGAHCGLVTPALARQPAAHSFGSD